MRKSLYQFALLIAAFGLSGTLFSATLVAQGASGGAALAPAREQEGKRAEFAFEFGDGVQGRSGHGPAIWLLHDAVQPSAPVAKYATATDSITTRICRSALLSVYRNIITEPR